MSGVNKTPNSVSISHLLAGDVLGVVAIADTLFGKGYLAPSEVQQYVNGKRKIGLVAKNNGVVIGFHFFLKSNLTELKELALSEQNWFVQQFSNKLPIGVLKTIAVRSEFKGYGIGTALTVKGMDILKHDCSCIISICWDQKEHTPFAYVLEKCGMKRTKTIKEFWKDDSLMKNYRCKICGTPPCKCTAFIYQYPV